MTDHVSPQSQAQHWLIAAWPGMAGVALAGAAHLIRTLHLQPAGELAPHDHFDVQHVHVKHGLIGKPRLPKNMFFTGQLPRAAGKLTVFIGEAQPAAGADGFAHELLGRAREMGVDRLTTFASFGSQMHPSATPSVFAAGTDQKLIDEAVAVGVKALDEAQIGGLNGVLLGAAMYRGIPGLCLLGEIPFYGAQIQNPKAVKHVLEIFGRISGVSLDTSELDAQTQQVDRVLLEMLANMQQRPDSQQLESAIREFDVGEASDEEITRSAQDEPAANDARREPDFAARERIEGLFASARKDRTQSVALKRELDALGVFAKYEDRFLDLFKQMD